MRITAYNISSASNTGITLDSIDESLVGQDKSSQVNVYAVV